MGRAAQGSLQREETSPEGQPRHSPRDVETILQAFIRSPRESLRRVRAERNIPRSTLHDVSHGRFKFRACRLKITQ